MVIGAVAVVLIGGGVGGWILLGDGGKPPAAVAGETMALSYPVLPSSGLELDAADFLGNGLTNYSTPNVISISDATVILAASGSADAGTGSEVTVAAVGRTTGDLLWQVDDSDLNPDGLWAENFDCTMGATKIVCALPLKSDADGSDGGFQVTQINPTDGSAISNEVEGGTGYGAAPRLIGDDILLARFENGDIEVARADTATGIDRWVSDDITMEGSEFYMPAVVGNHLKFTESIRRGEEMRYSTVFVSTDTGVRDSEVEGSVWGTMDALYAFEDDSSDSPEGVRRLTADGTEVWSVSGSDLLRYNYLPGQPVLSRDGDNLVALDPADGHELWTSAKKYESADVTAVRGNLAIVNDGSRYRIVDLNTGEQTGTVNGYVIGGNSEMFFTNPDMELTAYSSIGKKLWGSDLDDIESSIGEWARVELTDGILVLVSESTAWILEPQTSA